MTTATLDKTEETALEVQREFEFTLSPLGNKDYQLGGIQTNYAADLEDDDEYTIEIPRFRLLHPVSDEVKDGLGKAGQYHIDGLPPLPDPLIIIPMARGKSRQYRINRDIDRDEPLQCQSDDAKTGYGSPGGACDTCPINGQRLCTLIQRYIVWVPLTDGTGTMAVWELKKSGQYCAQRLNRLIRAKGFGKFAVHCSSKEATNAGNKYYRPIVNEVSVPEGEVPAVEEWLN